jgi:hypothetical protein
MSDIKKRSLIDLVRSSSLPDYPAMALSGTVCYVSGRFCYYNTLPLQEIEESKLFYNVFKYLAASLPYFMYKDAEKERRILEKRIRDRKTLGLNTDHIERLLWPFKLQGLAREVKRAIAKKDHSYGLYEKRTLPSAHPLNPAPDIDRNKSHPYGFGRFNYLFFDAKELISVYWRIDRTEENLLVEAQIERPLVSGYSRPVKVEEFLKDIVYYSAWKICQKYKRLDEFPKKIEEELYRKLRDEGYIDNLEIRRIDKLPTKPFYIANVTLKKDFDEIYRFLKSIIRDYDYDASNREKRMCLFCGKCFVIGDVVNGVTINSKRIYCVQRNCKSLYHKAKKLILQDEDLIKRIRQNEDLTADFIKQLVEQSENLTNNSEKQYVRQLLETRQKILKEYGERAYTIYPGLLKF